MKAEPENESTPAPAPTGDVIGDTAYSERFVLKILLKLANRDSLKEEMKETSFEEDLCTLWDMTAERDVVLYLQTHDALKLFHFALPVIQTPRLLEIILGTIANMACQREAVTSLVSNRDLLTHLLEYLKSDDSQILNQLIRMVSSCLYIAEERDIDTWMEMFEASEYPKAIYFILQNSSNKELLMTTLENLNTICSNCKIESQKENFSKLFETPDALSSVYTAHRELCEQASPDEGLERLHIITLQMMLHFHKSETSNGDSIDDHKNEESTPVNLLGDILNSYKSKMNEYYRIDVDFLDVLEAATVYIQYLEAIGNCPPDKYFIPAYNIWKALKPNVRPSGESVQFLDDIKKGLAFIMCIYLSKCSDVDLLRVADDIGDDYGSIVSQISDAELQAQIANRTLTNKNRNDCVKS